MGEKPNERREGDCRRDRNRRPARARLDSAIGDWLTALVAIASLAVLFRWKVSNPLLIAATAVVGLIAYPLCSPTG